MNERLKEEDILSKIYVIRDQKVMLDRDLSTLYEVETKYLKRQVKRNMQRFPEDFMFEVSVDELNSLRCQIGTLKQGEHEKYSAYAFTEQGIAMLSSVLRSEEAIRVNIYIIRMFTQMRHFLMNSQSVLLEMEDIKRHLLEHDHSIDQIMLYLKQFVQDKKSRKPIRFRKGNIDNTAT